ncbi:MAG: 4-(cytidine 5'-diphospho)-2-C-methyl-D-erythritol kinase, partial [Planctomycetota bacterium]
MFAYSTSNKFCIATPAKLNLFLELLGRRDDGFHELETVMVKFPLYDEIEFSLSQAEPIQLAIQTGRGVSHEAIPSDENNLIIKTLRIMRDLAGHSHGMAIRLFKRIPVQAGMGGASGNAAATIVAANHLWGLGLTTKRMREIASQVGSDVAFFLGDSLAKCTGRGEKVHFLNAHCRLNIVVAKPAIGLSTKDVYARCEVPHQPEHSDSIVTGLTKGRIHHICNGLFNRLEKAVENF